MSDKNGLDWVFIVDVTIKGDAPCDVFFAFPCDDYSKHSPLGKIESGKITSYEITNIKIAPNLPQGKFEDITDIFELNNIAKKLYDMNIAELNEYFAELHENGMQMGGM